MENSKVIDIVDIALLEVQTQAAFSSMNLQRVERSCLSFGNGWNGRWTLKLAVSCEEAAEILNDEALLATYHGKMYLSHGQFPFKVPLKSSLA
ncbi:hypothetical protein N7G274_004147 [Stereocaulon virgatum]|uniref:Uncharacterized protein n=1 Tax=Stereocaulon virgatum TaxID=373712 RepID=A0ABR4AB44_9LECA